MAGSSISLTAYNADGLIQPALAGCLAGGLVCRDQPRRTIFDLPAAPHPHSDGAQEQGEDQRKEHPGHRAREHGQGLTPGASCFDCSGPLFTARGGCSSRTGGQR